MKKIFKKVHLWLSLPFGIIFSIICFTGSILVFEKEITALVNPPTAQVQQVEHGQQTEQRQDGGQGLHGGQNAHGGQQSSIEKKQQARPASLPFFQAVRKLHRWLLDAPAKRGETSVGKVIVGISTIMMVLVLVSGLVIWIPKNKKQLDMRLKVVCNKGWMRFIHDSHVSLGIYVTIFLLLMALTGLTWSFGWYRDIAYGMFGNLMETTELRRLFYSLHTGSWGGIISKIIYFLSALIGGFLPWTGYYLWLKKKNHPDHHHH